MNHDTKICSFNKLGLAMMSLTHGDLFIIVTLSTIIAFGWAMRDKERKLRLLLYIILVYVSCVVSLVAALCLADFIKDPSHYNYRQGILYFVSAPALTLFLWLEYKKLIWRRSVLPVILLAFQLTFSIGFSLGQMDSFMIKECHTI